LFRRTTPKHNASTRLRHGVPQCGHVLWANAILVPIHPVHRADQIGHTVDDCNLKFPQDRNDLIECPWPAPA
jgi:hypothetical protein